jgi:DNA replication protein DnaC
MKADWLRPGTDGRRTLFITGEVVLENVKKQIKYMQEHHYPENEIKMLQCEIEGGDCPECGRTYRRKEVDNDHGFFEYFREPCDCREKAEKKRFELLRRRDEILKAGVPKKYLACSFDVWDFANDQGLNEVFLEVKGAVDRGEIWDRQGIVFCGTPGTGKTHTAVSVLKRAVLDLKSVRYISMADFIHLIINDKDYKIENFIEDVMLLDDIDKLNSGSDYAKERLFSLVESIIADGRHFIMTTNLEYEEMQERFDAALMSRIGGSTFFKMSGNDYRQYLRLKELGE